MEMSAKVRKNEKQKILDNHDQALECCGYLKTKLFMAKRISDQQLEIDELKKSLFSLTIKYTNLFDFIKNNKLTEKQIINSEQNNILQSNHKNIIINNDIENNNRITFNKLKKDQINLEENDDEIDLAKSSNTPNNEEDALNLSDNCARSIDFEKIPEINKIENEEKEKNSLFKMTGNNLKDFLDKNEKEKFYDQKIKILEEENLLLKKNNELLLQELQNTKLEVSKNSHEKFSLFSELNELVESLSRVDLDELNKFYFNNIKNEIVSKNSIYSAMGIKYNLLSTVNSLGLHSVNHSFPMNISENKFKNNNDIFQNDFTENNEYLGQLFSEKYLENIRENFHKYDEELNNYVYHVPEKINRNVKSAKNLSSNTKDNVNNFYTHYEKNSRLGSICIDSDTRTEI